jgi:hypothetical protein
MRSELTCSPPVDASLDLGACLAQVEASKEWFARRVLPLSIDQLRWRPDPARWSIAECLDHLNLTLHLCLPRVNAAAAAGRRQRCSWSGQPRYERPEIDALTSMEPPVTSPVVAPRSLIPAAAVDLEQLVSQFHEYRDRYADTVRGVSGLDISRILLVEPIVPCICSIGATLAYLAAHDRRHMWQSERVRHSSRFPKAAFGDGGH